MVQTNSNSRDQVAVAVAIDEGDLAMAVLVDLLDAAKFSVARKPDQPAPAAVLVNGVKLSGHVTIAKFLVGLAGSPLWTEWLGTSDTDKSQIEKDMVAAIQLSKSLGGTDADAIATSLKNLNDTLSSKTFISGNYFTLADLFTYTAIYIRMNKMNKEARIKYCHVTRYFDLIQRLAHSFGKVVATDIVPVELDVPVESEPVEDKKKPTPATSGAPSTDKSADNKKKEKSKKADGAAPAANGKADVKKGERSKKDVAAEPKKAEKKEVVPSTAEPESAELPTPEPDRLDLRVGHIVTVKRHAQAETLYVEEIDVGEGAPRTVVSGLVKYLKEEDLKDKMVVLLCNLEPRKMRGVESQAMVLAATSTDGNTVELLEAPKGSKPGDRCWFDMYKGTGEKTVLNPKKKIWEAVQPRLRTDAFKRATLVQNDAGFKSISILRTDAGEVTVKSVVGASIK